MGAPRNHSLGRRMQSVASFLGAMTTCAAAAEAGRMPSRSALTRIGIDADKFYHINRERL